MEPEHGVGTLHHEADLRNISQNVEFFIDSQVLAFTQQHAHRQHPLKIKVSHVHVVGFAVEGNTVECRFRTKSAAL